MVKNKIKNSMALCTYSIVFSVEGIRSPCPFCLHDMLKILNMHNI